MEGNAGARLGTRSAGELAFQNAVVNFFVFLSNETKTKHMSS